MASPRDRVFDTPELLEAILVQLPQQDLLLAQRISRSFETAIKSSPKIQQALFFRAEPIKDPRKWFINPILRRHFLPFFVLSPAAQDLKSIELLDWVAGDRTRKAFLYKNASWRKMLIIQPPPQNLSIVEFCNADGGDDKRTAEIPFEDTQGVSMGTVYDIAQSFVCNEEQSDFGLSILDSETGPQITLYLRYTSQCCIDQEFPIPYDLKSEDASANAYEELKFVSSGVGVGEDGIYYECRIDMDWTTDLTLERGGVDVLEYKNWCRKRFSVSRNRRAFSPPDDP